MLKDISIIPVDAPKIKIIYRLIQNDYAETKYRGGGVLLSILREKTCGSDVILRRYDLKHTRVEPDG